jgi:hypothetical protein
VRLVFTVLIGTMLVHCAFNYMVLSLHGDLQMIAVANVVVGGMILLVVLIAGRDKLTSFRGALQSRVSQPVAQKAGVVPDLR